LTDAVLFEVQGATAIITLNRPDQRNAVNADICDGLRNAVDRLENTPELRVGILRGAGKVFCAGMDLKAYLAGGADDVLMGKHGFAGFVKRQRTKPIIASVQGAALAGGFEIMLACDMVIATNDAIFGLPEAKIGLVAGAGGAIRLGALLPPAIANEILLTGDTFNAPRAQSLGLVNRVVAPDDRDASALSLALKISENAPLSVAAGLRLAALGGRPTDAMWQANDQEIQDINESYDAKEGVAAFLEKRPPNWTGY
jgi:enoyl-CoA hydratase